MQNVLFLLAFLVMLSMVVWIMRPQSEPMAFVRSAQSFLVMLSHKVLNSVTVSKLRADRHSEKCWR